MIGEDVDVRSAAALIKLCANHTLLQNHDYKKLIGEFCLYQRLSDIDLYEIVTQEEEASKMKKHLENRHLTHR